MIATDESLIESMASGDRAAFAALYDRHASRVFGLLISLMRDRAAAEDVLQDAFLELWRRASQFDSARASGVGWLALIARSRALDQLRKRKPQPESPGAFERLSIPDALPQLHERESAEATRQALERLPKEQRDAIVMSYYGGLSHQAIAHRTELPLGTVKTRIRLGMQRLRDALKDWH